MMRKKFSALILLVLLLAAFPCIAHVHLAHTSKNAHLRAGPARDYPVVATLPAGFEVEVQGCLRDYSWCDVIAGPDRGWIYAGNINVAYRGVGVPVLNYGAEIGIAVVGFILLDYWAFHYHDRPYYRERELWVPRPRPPRIIGPPPIRRPEPPKRPDPPPHRGEPGVRLPPQEGPPGTQQPPPKPGSPGAPRPQPPRQDSPGAKPPVPPQPGAPEKQRPLPPPPGIPRS